MFESLFDRQGLQVQRQLMLNAKMSLFSLRNLISVSSYLGSKVLPMSATLEGSSMDNSICLLSVSSDWINFLEFLESDMTRSGGGRGGGLGQSFLQLLELCRCCQSVSHLTALLIIVIGPLDVPSRHSLESP
jgi:hypothetical protein